MPTFSVYVEFYGKKLKIEVEADNEFRADNLVRSKLHILKVVEKTPEQNKKSATNDDSGLNFLKGIFGI